MSAKKSETLDDLLDALPAGERLDVFATRAGINPKTLFRLRQGQVDRPHRGTIKLLATALKLPEARVREALAGSRAAALRDAE